MMLSDQSFDAVSRMFHEVSGIRLGPAKRALVSGRLQKLAQDRGIADLDTYVAQLLQSGDAGELVRAVDKLTTNETYFFREPEHFDVLAHFAADHARSGKPLRAWSAASSSGEEAFSIAMVLAETLGSSSPWEIVGTDLSTAMVESARRGHYTMERARNVSQPLLKKYCLKGQGPYEGTMLVSRELRQRVRFETANLMRELPDIGRFDVVFLRNVLIYFDNEAKRQIILRVLDRVKPEGLLFIGHAESVTSLGLPMRTVAPAVYAHE